MNLSPCPPPAQQGFDFELDTKVKWVKTGRRKTEGWLRKVFKMPRCQQAIKLMMKPGRKNVERAMAAPGSTFARVGRALYVPATAEARATPLPTSALLVKAH